jgi:Ca2+-binding EF-hand superfamily protein
VSSFYQVIPGAARGSFCALLLATYDRDKSAKLGREEIGLDPKSFGVLDQNQDGGLDAEELAFWLDRNPDLELSVNLKRDGTQIEQGKTKGAGPVARKTTAGSLLVTVGDAEINIQGPSPPGLQGTRANVNVFYLNQFRQADKDGRGFVEMKDLQGPQANFLRQLFPMLDRDGDGKLREKEVQAFLALLTPAADSHAGFAFVDQGRSFFQILDTNRDGRFSQRELRNGWKTLEGRGLGKEGAFRLDEIPRQFQLALMRGSSQAAFNPQIAFTVQGNFAPRPPFTYPPGVPLWFRKMDLNADGDVSRREFLGSAKDFTRLDADGDGLIDAQEAANGDGRRLRIGK